MSNHLIIAVLILAATACNTRHDNHNVNASTTKSISDALKQASCVYLTSDDSNKPVISWCETDAGGHQLMRYATFDTAEQHFLVGGSIPVEGNISLHEEGMPKLAYKGDGTMIAIYETSDPTKENQWAGQVRYMQSDDTGKTWTAPRPVHTDTTMRNSHSFAAIARLSNGEIGACWLDQTFDFKKGGRPVKFARTNGKNGFTGEVLIDSLACECCRIGIAAGEANVVDIVYRDIASDSVRDIAIATSTNNGQSFSSPVTFSADNWYINGCPHNGPSLARTANTTYAAWFTGSNAGGVYYGELDDKLSMIRKKCLSSNGRNIQLCVLPDGSRVAAYSEHIRRSDSLYSRIVVKRIDRERITELAVTPDNAHATYPVIARCGAGYMVVAWVENSRVNYRMLRSTDITKPTSVSEAAVTPHLNVAMPHHAAKKDPVCGMVLRGGIADTAIVSGKTIAFCSAGCKERFIKDPDSYREKIK